MNLNLRQIEAPDDEVRDLVDVYLGGEATDEQIAELNKRIETDTQAAAYATAALDLNATLAWTRRGPQAVPMPAAPVAPSGPGRAWSASLAIAAALLLAAGIVAIYLIATAPTSEPAEPKGPPIATLISASGTVVVDDVVATTGQDYPAGAIALTSGSAEFLLGNGSRVVLRGRTQLIVDDPMHARLTYGSASFVCSDKAAGYTVRLAGGIDVVDLGTAFGVRANSDGSGREVWVTEGSVRIDGIERPVELAIGDAVRIGADGTAVPVAIDPVRHLGVDEALVGLWRFDDASDLGRSSWVGPVLDVVADARSVEDDVRGAVLQLDGDGDMLTTTLGIDRLPTGASPYTVAAWIKPTEIATRGIIGWGAYGEDGRVNALRLHDGGGLRHYWWANDLHASEAETPIDQWTHVAATWDGMTRRVYVNGRPIAEDRPGSPDIADEQFAIGRTFADKGEYFAGRLDDVAIFNRALDQTEIIDIQNGEFADQHLEQDEPSQAGTHR